MNRIWAALAILVVLFSVSIWGAYEVDKMTGEVSEMLIEVRNGIDSGETEQSKDVMENVVNTWHKYHHIMSFFIPHERLENVSQTLKTTESFLETGTEDEARAECSRALDQIHTLMDTEMPYPNNIL